MSNLHTRDIGVAIILGTAWKKHKYPLNVTNWGVPGWRSHQASAFGSGHDPGVQAITSELWLNHAKTVCKVVHMGNYEWVQRQLKLLFCCSDSLGARPHAARPQEQRCQAPLVTAGLPLQAGPRKVHSSHGLPHLLPVVSGRWPPSPYYLCILSREFMLFFLTTAI